MRKLYQVVGVATEQEFTVHNGSLLNVLRGVYERVFYVKGPNGFTSPPSPQPGVYSSKLAYIKSFFKKILPETAPITHKQFVEMYEGRRRKRYEDAARSLCSRPIVRADANIQTFGKAEKINLSVKPDPVMRIISPRDPRYNIVVGCYLKPIEHLVYSGIAKLFGEPTVAKGLNALEVGNLLERKWAKYASPVAIGLDASRFDQHVSVQALKWEHGVYLNMYRNDPKLQKLLSWQLTNKCRAYFREGSIKYTVKGTRMSGDMNTAMGNCLIMCSLVHAYIQSTGIKHSSLINNGDDCVVVLDKRNLGRFMQGLTSWFHGMGFTMICDTPVYNLEEIMFCQTQPVYNGTQYVMVRSPSIAMSKDSYSIKPLDSKSIYEKWVGAVGLCGASLSGGIPIMQEYYQSYIRASHGRCLKNDLLLETGMAQMARGMKPRWSAITPRARASFYLAFKITPDMQECVEGHMKAWTPNWAGIRDTSCHDVGVPWLL